MINDRLDRLREYPFQRMADLIAGIEPAGGRREAIALWIGEPRHGVPELCRRPLAAGFEGYGVYPPVEGTPGLRRAMASWLARRYRLPAGLVDPDGAVLPLQGTREGLFMVALAAVPRRKAGGVPLALLPNPFYQPYKAGAVAAGAEPVYLSCTAATGFLPDLDALAPALLERTAIFYLCSPANPQGAVADLAYWRRAVALARRYDFLLVADECYAEIYDRAPPIGVLEACAEDGSLAHVLCFHSLSKRSGVPGLRAGFAAGDPAFVAAFLRLRKYAAAASAMAHYAAAEALWSDEAHVEENRRLYRRKLDLAEGILAGRFGFFRPPGGFFLWLDVGDGVEAARRLWAEAGVKVLPGRYLAADAEDGGNEAHAYIRVALVDDVETTGAALERIAATL